MNKEWKTKAAALFATWVISLGIGWTAEATISSQDVPVHSSDFAE